VTNIGVQSVLFWAFARIVGEHAGLLPVEPITVRTHETGLAIAERYRLSVYDAMIAASALLAGCNRLWSEDMQNGLVIDRQLRIVDPFGSTAA